MLNKRELFYLIIAAIPCVLILIFFPLIDLEFSQSIYSYRVWADWMLRFAPLPGILAAFLLSVRLTTYSVLRTVTKKEDSSSPLQMIIGIGSVIFLPILTFWRLMAFFDQTVDLIGWSMIFVIIVFSMMASYFRNREIPSKTRRVLSSRALTGVLVFYVLNGIAVLVSYFWNRVSYRTLISVGTVEYYTPWFRASSSNLLFSLTWQRFTFGSFPSLSVVSAGAAGIFAYFTEGTNRRARNTIFMVSYLYQLFIAVLALMNGQCYVTDAAFSLLLSSIVFALAEHILYLIHPEDYGNMYELISGID